MKRGDAFIYTATTLALAACGPPSQYNDVKPLSGKQDSGRAPAKIPHDWFVPREPQRVGNADRGWDALIHKSYLSCGISPTAFTAASVSGAFGSGEEPIASRQDGVAYGWTLHSDTGEDLVSPNCFLCHAGRFNGELHFGLGNADINFSPPESVVDWGARLYQPEADGFVEFIERFLPIFKSVRPRVRGANPAGMVPFQVFAYRQEDLSWSEEPLLETSELPHAPSDVPPWWWYKKKNVMFYNAMGRGDHTRHMMLLSSVCADSNDEAEAIWSYFDDVRAYIESIEPPEYPFAINPALAEDGKAIYHRECARCHGGYDEYETLYPYPNVVVPLDVIGTDPAVAQLPRKASEILARVHATPYGTDAPLDPAEGYMAPPMDGIAFTGPFGHNGAWPTVEAALNSKARPTYWRRAHADWDTTDFDEEKLGFRYQEVSASEAGDNKVYDTTIDGYRSTGHTFGDHLSSEERRAVIEYLKTN